MKRLSLAELGALSDLVDALPTLVLIADPEMRILDLNAAASRGLAASRGDVCGKQAGEVLNCDHWDRASGGCGRSERCGECLVRNSLGRAIAERRAVVERRLCGGRTGKGPCENGRPIDVFLQVTAAPFEHEGEPLVFLLMNDVTELTLLRRLLPVCADCGSVRNDAAYLESVRAYLATKPELDYAHAICPACRRKPCPDHDA